MAETARKNSILALEKVQIEEPFMKKAIKMLVDGVEPEVIEDIMAAEMEAMEQRHGEARGCGVTSCSITWFWYDRYCNWFDRHDG